MKIIPEINYYFGKSVDLVNVNIDYQFHTPEYIKEDIIQENNFIALLFLDEYKHDNFVYKFKRFYINDLKSIKLKRRLSVYYDPEIYLCHDNGDNIFELNSNDVFMIFKLFQYKTQGVFNDGDIIFDNLSKLGKLIYVDLKFMSDNTLMDLDIDLNDITNEPYLILCYAYHLSILRKILESYK